MNGRMKKYRQLSPERAIVWSEKYRYIHHNSPTPPPTQRQQHHARKVPVVYYLCRNRQLQHPHFMEVTLFSDHLYLRDVIERLNILRGRGIGSMYSWSCKRSYRNGFVWQDLCDDDVIHPAHGNEYILKGSELFEESNPGGLSPAPTFMIQSQRTVPETPSPQNQETSSSSSSSNGGSAKSWHDDEPLPRLQHPCASPELSAEKNPTCSGSLSLTESKSEGITDASTQNEEKDHPGDVERGVSTDDNQVSRVKEDAEVCRTLVSSPPTAPAPSAASLSVSTETLESLIRADLRKLNSFKVLEEKGFQIPSSMKLKIVNMIVQLISCGSVQDKGHSIGLVKNCRPLFSSSKFSNSLTSGKLDHLHENPGPMGMKLAQKKSLNRSSCNADRSTQQHIDSIVDKKEGSSTSSLRSSLSEDCRISSKRAESSRISEPDVSNGSKRKTDPLSGENVIKKES